MITVTDKVTLARFGIEVKVPAHRTDTENAVALDRIEQAVRDQLAGIGKMIEAAIEGSEVVEDRR